MLKIGKYRKNYETTHTKNHENKTLCMKDDKYKAQNQQGNSNIGSAPNENTTDHQKNRLNENRITSAYSSAVRHKSKNIVLFNDNILRILHMGELNRYLKSRKVHLKSFAQSKA